MVMELNKGWQRASKKKMAVRGVAIIAFSSNFHTPNTSARLPVVIQKSAALLAICLAQCMGGLAHQHMLVQFHTVEGVARQSKPILVDQICIPMLTCRAQKRPGVGAPLGVHAHGFCMALVYSYQAVVTIRLLLVKRLTV